MKSGTEPGPFEQEQVNSSLYDEALSHIDKILQNVKKGQPFSLIPLSEVVSKFIDSLLVRDDLLKKALYLKAPTLDIPSHLLNVCIFAIEIGISLHYIRDDLERLGLAAIVHDLGMVRVPENILKKPGRLSPGEFDIVKKHPEESAAILSNLDEDRRVKFRSWLAEIALQEHERYDGNGYPKGLKGDEIHEFALIIGIADVYEALTHHRFQRKNLQPLDSMKEILSIERASFPEKIIKALIAKLPVFPVGAMVRLSSKEIGVVVSSNSSSPFRPTVKIIFGPSGNRPKTERIINLKENPLLYIISLVSEEEIDLK